MKRGEIKTDPERVRRWKQRSAARAQERDRARARELPRATEAARAAMSKANPPRPDPAPTAVRRRRPNPGDSPTPPLPPGATCCCAVCVGSGSPRRAVHNHHIIYRQELRRLRANAGDPRGVMPVAYGCHAAHHAGARRLPLSVIPDAGYEFVIEVLGAAGFDYLRRRYSGEDPRLDMILQTTAAVPGGDRTEGSGEDG